MDNEEKLEWLWDRFSHLKSFSKDKTERDLEKKLISYFDYDSLWEDFQGYLDVMLEDTAPNKVKKLSVVMKSFLTFNKVKVDLDEIQTEEPVLNDKPVVKEVRPGVYVGVNIPSVFSYLPPPSEEDLKKEKAFEDLWSTWPRGNYPESKQLAREIFMEVSNTIPYEDIFAGCKAYADNFNSSFNSDSYVKSLRGFIDDKVKYLLPWIERNRELESKSIDILEAREYFDAAWSWWPKYGKTFSEKVMQDNFSIYRRHVSKEKVPDFFCAVQYYFRECYYAVHQEDQDPKFFKSFQSFMSDWEQTNPYEQMAEMIITPFITAIKKRDISKHPALMMLWGTEGIRNIVLFNSKGSDKTVAKAIEGSVRSAYTGFANLEPDFTAVGEIREEVWKKAKEKKPDWVARSAS